MTNEEFLALLKSEESRRAIMEMIIAELRVNGPIRMALLGVFPDDVKRDPKSNA